MKAEATFRPYSSEDRGVCLELFDANCPEFFAPDERADYARFLDTCPGGYELCLIHDQVAGAFGLIGSGATRRRLNWIMLHPHFHGRGVGQRVMERVAAHAAFVGIQAVDIAASHKSAPFFEKCGAVTVAVTQDGWGKGMHRVDMELLLRPDNSLGRTRGR